jgi:ferric-dicitrate binding protein FerR (iron transport regulator)
MNNKQNNNWDGCEEIAARFVSGEADETDAGCLLRMMEEDPETAGRLFQLKDIYDAAGFYGRVRPVRRVRPLVRIMRYAAVLLLGVSIAGPVSYLSARRESDLAWSEVRTGKNERTSVTLPDGSSVALNSHSSIRYKGNFSSGHREVYMQGTAWFEVESDSKNSFKVITPSLSVTATGTAFSIDDSRDVEIKDVTLAEGRVTVAKIDERGLEHVIAELTPNDHLSYNASTSTFGVKNEDIYKYYAWKDNLLVFRNDPFPDVIDRISRRYGVDIELQGTELQNYRYRATFEDESLDEIMHLLKLSAPIEYTQLKRTQLPDGSFSPVKIVIRPGK